ncbi:hypothetical protein ACFFNY_34990 [Paenibacillus hodogayensis]|uniref:Uncharacterized protein n=1 Tax=Paenibacillus hodogayensis TaxID=279208 RepID=A0ABV5W981_9BACL
MVYTLLVVRSPVGIRSIVIMAFAEMVVVIVVIIIVAVVHAHHLP